ncbi:MAG: hypothetical protein M9894_23935 [Planctomycetes bacterium]|nr:hypothetical protein [Planctomycetota bacterium]
MNNLDSVSALNALLAHAGNRSDDPRSDTGFTGMLRPYTGLRESNFVEVMEALYCLRDELRGDLIPRCCVASAWDLCRTARTLGLSPRTSLQRNRLISADDVQRLASWVETIEASTLFLLHGKDDSIAFFGMIRLIADGRVKPTSLPWLTVASKILMDGFYLPEDHLLAVRALMALRSPEALGVLEAASVSSDEIEVRVAAAEAMRVIRGIRQDK